MDFLREGMLEAVRIILSMDEELLNVAAVTVKSSFLAMCMASAVGLPVGIALGALRFPGRRALRLLFDSLLSVPTVVVGLVVYGFISNQGPFGRFELLFTLWGMAIGQAVLGLPVLVSLVASAVESVDPLVVMTLRTLGFRGLRLLWALVLEMRHALMMALLAAYGRVVSEVGVSMMIGGNIRWHTRTLTTAIAFEASRGDFGMAVALGLVLLIISSLVSACVSLMRWRAKG
ncbi:ABC-type tungstate transport system, periplasmic component [Thermanaerovibrio velox DSM 12556]|uniref:ABC-type tungstate transport system, periplasmic component n=1 Tax=Thermanaerovibrio velox DSM 12556 TaxID=926567 RepID=H0UQB6_9BACT|nr:ABC transporter permease [Thermanaerovibrio velox]EHM10754.1 ABC-type tungstate transport system, periplasmic component [Thermanaerovibrio velox DSM 12556]MCX7828714.1 ABC transporter permease [Thermanaerothrix sp.]